jgi:hypothetical protein
MALSLLMGVMVCPKRACGLSPVNSTLSILSLIILKNPNGITLNRPKERESPHETAHIIGIKE